MATIENIVDDVAKWVIQNKRHLQPEDLSKILKKYGEDAEVNIRALMGYFRSKEGKEAFGKRIKFYLGR